METYVTLYLAIPFYVIYFICYTVTGEYIRKIFKERCLLHVFTVSGLIYGTFIFLHHIYVTDFHNVLSINDSLNCSCSIVQTYPFILFIPFIFTSIIFNKTLNFYRTETLLTYSVLIIWIYISTVFIYIIYRLFISRLTDVIILLVPIFIFILFFALYRVYLLTWKRKNAEIMEFILFIIISLLLIMIFSFLSNRLTYIHEKLMVIDEDSLKNALKIEFIRDRYTLYSHLLGCRVKKGYILAKDGKYDEAIKAFNNSEDGWIITGSLLVDNCKYDEAIRHYDKAIDINPECIRAYQKKGELLVKHGKYDEAIRCYDSALHIKPYYISIFLDKAEILINQGRYNEAIKCCDSALKVSPQHLRAWAIKGNILFSNGRYEEAIKCYYNVIDLHTIHDEWNCNCFPLTDDEYDEIIENKEEALKIIKRKNKNYQAKPEIFSIIKFYLYNPHYMYKF